MPDLGRLSAESVIPNGAFDLQEGLLKAFQREAYIARWIGGRPQERVRTCAQRNS